jgi:tryptophan 2,3-dioxygenase
VKNRSALPDELFRSLSRQGQACANRDADCKPESHPVVEATVSTMWDYLYQAKHSEQDTILACDNLLKLKQAVRNRGWRMAWITTSKGMLSYGQNVVNEYPYVPRYA